MLAKVLLLVPGAAGDGVTQGGHDVQQAAEFHLGGRSWGHPGETREPRCAVQSRLHREAEEPAPSRGRDYKSCVLFGSVQYRRAGDVGPAATERDRKRAPRQTQNLGWKRVQSPIPGYPCRNGQRTHCSREPTSFTVWPRRLRPPRSRPRY